ncbi:MAG: hypothetical protein KA785_04125, partial [Spirochaetaceae bacterium]|nr:hypothetical protein [Spirochaetaceae bacterium]
MGEKAMDLYEAYKANKLPKDEGYVVSGFFMNDTPYTILEIISYSEVKNFYASGDSITFQSNGKKIYILVEPTTYTQKAQEPYVRPSKFQIPLRFNDLEIYTCRNQYKIMYSKEPQMVMTSFTILKPSGLNFSFIVFAKDGIQQTLTALLQKTFNQNANVPLADSKKVSEDLAEKVLKELSWPNKEGAGKVKTKSNSASADKTVSKKTAAKAEKAVPKAAKEKAAAKTAAKAPAKAAVKPAAKAAPKTAVKEKAAAKTTAKAPAKASAKDKTAPKTAAKAAPKTAVKEKAAAKTAAKAPAKAAAKPAAKAAPKTAVKEKAAAKTAAKAPAKAAVKPAAKAAAKTAVKEKAAAKTAAKAPAKTAA